MQPFVVRRSLFEKASTFNVEGDALVRSVDGRGRQSVSLSGLRRVRLSYRPLTMVARWVCSVEGHGGRIWIPSASFYGLGRAEDARSDFRPFVVDLHRAIAAASASSSPARPTRFVQGDTAVAIVSLLLVIVFGVVALGMAIVGLTELAAGHFSDGIRSAFFVLVVAGGSYSILWQSWRRNIAHVYDPASLPADFAPPR